ncbi:hypothetical protein B7494_g5067 [Chlorociboria aeruginascens]|nr:hypothetical protein B7494_g5067 [Chlorociboria aeruginascens]
MASAQSLEVLWQQTFAAYEKDTGRKLNHESVLRTLKTPEDLLKQIESEGQIFLDWRNKHSKLWASLKSLLGPITALGKITRDVAAQSAWAPAPAVLGSVLYLVKMCEQVSKAYDWIEQIFAELQEFSKRLSHYFSHDNIDAGLKAKAVAILAFMLQIIGRSEKLVRQGRFGHYLRVTFLGKDEKTRKLLENLNRQLTGEHYYVLALTYTSAKKIEETSSRIESLEKDMHNDVQAIVEDVGAVSADIDNLSSSVKDFRDMNNHEQEKALLEHTLSGNSALDDTLEMFHIYEKALLKNSGYWLQEEPLFKIWANHKAAVLWLFGGPGVGKSYLSTSIIKYLKERYEKDHENGDGPFIGYFFVKENKEVLRDANIILKTLAWQIAESDAVFRNHAIKVCKSRGSTVTTEQTWENIFLAFYQSDLGQGRRIILVVDGLDEASLENRRQLIKCVQSLALGSSTTCIQFAIIGQGADGVFLWAQLLLDQIMEKDLTKIEEILADPPHDLDEMIWSAFERLAKDEDFDPDSLKKLLTWVAFSRRPLSVGEIDLVLSLRKERPDFLLWSNLRGRFSSIFELKSPRNYDLEARTESIGSTDTEKVESVIEPDFDFSGDNDGDPGPSSVYQLLTNDELFSNHGFPGLEKRVDIETFHGKNVSHLSDSQLNTIVTFRHQRIRDYLTERSSRSRIQSQGNISIDIPRADIYITITCLGILRQDLALQEDTRDLVDYPARNLVWHLRNIDKNDIDENDHFEIIDGLYWLFHSLVGTESLLRATKIRRDKARDEFWNTWIATDRHCKTIQTWLGDADLIPHLFDEEALTWMRLASGSIKELLKPLMTTAASLWLTKSGFTKDGYRDFSTPGIFCIWLLNAYSKMDDNGAISDDIRDWAWYKCSLRELGADTIQRLADETQIEHTKYWHMALGWNMMMGSYYDPATKHFEEALKQDNDAMPALEGLCRCLGEQKLYQKAIEFHERALKSFGESKSFPKARFFSRIAEWKNELGDKDGASEAAWNGYHADHKNPMAVMQVLKALDRANKPKMIIDFLRILNDTMVEGRDYPYLVHFLRGGRRQNAFPEIGKACRAEGNPKFVLAAMDRALEVVDEAHGEKKRAKLRMRMAELRYSYYDQVDEPMRLWESAIELISEKTPSLQEVHAIERERCVNSLAQLYFDAAVALSTASTDKVKKSNPYADKLKRLSATVEILKDEADQGFYFYKNSYPSMLWGRWMRDYLGAEESAWKKCFKPRLLEQMDMLDDDDPSNDQDGLHALGITLFHAGDRANAGAILAIHFKYIEENNLPKPITEESLTSKEDYIESNTTNQKRHTMNEETKEGFSTAPKEPEFKDTITHTEEIKNLSLSARPGEGGPRPRVDRTLSLKLHFTPDWTYFCESCHKSTIQVEELHRCEMCSNANFCGDCLPKVKNGSLPRRICNPSHSFYRAWPIQDDARNMAEESIGGEVRLRKEWLENLRGLPNNECMVLVL